MNESFYPEEVQNNESYAKANYSKNICGYDNAIALSTRHQRIFK